LHLGHARTFGIAAERARAAGGILILRNEDLDPDRCQPQFVAAMFEDLRWLGFDWQAGPDVGGPHAPYNQSQRLPYFRDVWARLAAQGAIYPSPHSRKDLQHALLAPHNDEAEPIFPPELRPPLAAGAGATEPGPVNWRFRVPDGERISFIDGRAGRVERAAGIDFGDFLVWRKDGFPAYELAVVADDHAMGVSEVVRGEDLLTSTARQLLIYRALSWTPPQFFHCELLRDAQGRRLAKRHGALAIRTLRESGRSASSVLDQIRGAT
jgi:glutamyl-tRNA synthetase